MLEHKSQYVFYMNQDGVVFNVYVFDIIAKPTLLFYIYQ